MGLDLVLGLVKFSAVTLKNYTRRSIGMAAQTCQGKRSKPKPPFSILSGSAYDMNGKKADASFVEARSEGLP
jgi:hypothetical protein